VNRQNLRIEVWTSMSLRTNRRRLCQSSLLGAALACLAANALAAPDSMRGRVIDSNGAAIAGAMVTFESSKRAAGPDAVTVFTDAAGRFAVSESAAAGIDEPSDITVRAAGFELLAPLAGRPDAGDIVAVMQSSANAAASAPASAWLADVPDDDAKAVLISSCVNCHQFPTPEVRDFARSLEAVHGAEPDQVRALGWQAMVKYMRFKFADALGRGFGPPPSYEFATDPERFLPNREDEAILIEVLRDHLPRRFEALDAYAYGAPLAVNGSTVIREYTVPGPNAIREALSLGGGREIWVADFFGDQVVRIDPVTGVQRNYPVPFDGPTGPHTLVRDRDGALWVSMLFNSLLARIEPGSGEWRLWRLWEPQAGAGSGPVVVHDMAYDHAFAIAPDAKGRIWSTDIANNALVSLDPATGAVTHHPAPGVPGRNAADTQMYGLAISSDRRTVWYAQLWGYFGAFNTETLEYETVVEVPIGAGPRRPAITEDDILYMPLFGTGQIVEYDIRARRQLAIHDLPDRASGPYAVTWDPRRRLLWVPTSNSDVVYRFDPASRGFGVIPLPRPKTFLRMLSVDPDTGWLVTSAGNLPEDADGPRTALVIDPGDGYATASDVRSRPLAQQQ
jgi:streptogramin lyase